MTQASDRSHTPGPGRSTSEAAFEALTKSVAERNLQAHKAARSLREQADVKILSEKRRRDLA